MASGLTAAVMAALPKVAAATEGLDAALIGGTAIALQLGHRDSYDLDVIVGAPFDSGAVAARLAAEADFYHEIAREADGLRALMDGVDIQVFRGTFRTCQEGPARLGMRLASLPDLLALKLEAVRHRTLLRDFLDIATLDEQPGLSIEEGLTYHAWRFSVPVGGIEARDILNRLSAPPLLPPDPAFDHLKHFTLQRLEQRAYQAQSWLSGTADTEDQTEPPTRPRLT